jgi:anti-sigma regulatory factor (Ser/Thr protein kinase)
MLPVRINPSQAVITSGPQSHNSNTPTRDASVIAVMTPLEDGRFTVYRSEEAVRGARKIVEILAEQAGASRAAIGDLALLTAEGVTNAFLHGTGAIGVTVFDTGMYLRVEVRDEGPASSAAEHSRLDHGRGFDLIAGFAADWAYEETSSGTLLWFEVKKQ